MYVRVPYRTKTRKVDYIHTYRTLANVYIVIKRRKEGIDKGRRQARKREREKWWY